MRLLLLYNASSGRGRGAAVAETFLHALRAAGHGAEPLAVRRDSAFPEHLAGALGNADILVAIGGDGTVHHALAPAVAAGAAVYHAPLGNENLFAREFGTDARPATLLEALREPRFGRVDLGHVEPIGPDGRAGPARPFALMCSLGPDASVIHRLALARRRALGHLAYALPTLAELRRPTFPRLTVEVDGRVVVDAACGLLVVANSRQYALRIDPAVRASMTDGLLDAVFFPCRSRSRVLLWAARARLRRHVDVRGLVYERGQQVAVRVHGGGVYQLDGEAVPDLAPSPADTMLRLEAEPEVLKILLPRVPVNTQTEWAC